MQQDQTEKKNAETIHISATTTMNNDNSSSNNNNNNNNKNAFDLIGLENGYQNVFLDQVKQMIQQMGDKPFATWYDDNGKRTNEFAFQALWDESGRIAYALRKKWGIQKGQLVILCYDFGLHFFAAFFGCVRAGVTAVIVYPPGPPLQKSLTKMANVIADCSPALILTDSKINLLRTADTNNPFSKSRHLWPKNVPFKVTNVSLAPKSFDEPNIMPSDLAFLQYTSGSTGNPKGVMVSYSALASNISVISDVIIKKYDTEGKSYKDFIGFSWLPQYHDMGLMICFIVPFTLGLRMHMMSPISFIRNPLLWIDLMSQHKVQWSIGPDFAYRLVTRKYFEAQEIQSKNNCPIHNLDLSSILQLLSAAEPIRTSTVDTFSNTFGKYGLRKKWFASSYGLAESVVCVCTLGEFVVETEPNSLMEQHPNQPDFVAVGGRKYIHPSVTVKIVHPETCVEVEDGQSGEIWVSGPSIATGYFRQPGLTQETFHGKIIRNCSIEQEQDTNSDTVSYLRTGDKGFFLDDRLYICGRYKDIIIMNGVNYYPNDIENVVQASSLSDIRPGCCAAFSSNDSGRDGELVVVFEIRNSATERVESVCHNVQAAISREIGLMAQVVAIKERTICKTTSGKIQRRRNRIFWQEGKHQIVYQIESLSSSPTAATILNQDDEEQTSNPSNNIDNITLDMFLQRMFGQEIDNGQSWSDLELTSIQSVEISTFVAKKNGVQLPSNFMDTCPTIADLKAYIFDTQGKLIDVSLPDLLNADKKEITWTMLTIYQFVGVLGLLVMITAPIIPAVLFARSVKWYWTPFIFPFWMFGYSCSVVVAKWMVIGKYKEQKIIVPSTSFVRWWFIDRAVYIWGVWVGYYIKDSPFQWLFYSLMGAKIHPSAKIDASIREFDLVEIKANSIISCSLKCSKFAHAKQGTKKLLQFRKIVVQSDCIIDGYLSPGVLVGKGAQVETNSMVAEGGQVPSCSIIRGNPACQFGLIKEEQNKNATNQWWQLGILKILSYPIFLYMSYGCLGLGLYLVKHQIMISWISWQYSSIYLTIISVLAGLVLSLFLNIILKWLLIGKRRPGPYNNNLRTLFLEWFVDYHFEISTKIFGGMSSGLRIWSLILKLYGMDIDWSSRPIIFNFPPSKVDLISMNKSFTSTITIKVKKDNTLFRTIISESSVGWMTCLTPGVHISKAITYPLSTVSQDIIRDEQEERMDPRFVTMTNLQFVWNWVLIDGLYVLFYSLIATSIIPSYELYYTLLQGNEMFSLSWIIPVASLLIIVQSIMLIISLNIIQLFTYLCFNTNRTEPWNYPLQMVTISALSFIQSYNIIFQLLWGTPFYNVIAKFLGSKFTGKGHVLFWGFIYDFPYLTFEDDTIVDGGNLCGHHVVHRKMTLGHTTISGTVHPVTFTMANVIIKDDETGPWCAPVCMDGNKKK